MRHKKKRSLNNRFTSWRVATLKGIACSVLTHQSITTTLSKATFSRPMVDSLITLAKDGSLAARRRAYALIGDHAFVKNLFDTLGPRFKARSGGYTRIIRLGSRRGDGAERVLFQLTEIVEKEKKGPKKAKAAKPEGEKHAEGPHDQTGVHGEPSIKTAVAPEEERPPRRERKPKKFLGGLRNIFKKERDSL